MVLYCKASHIGTRIFVKMWISNVIKLLDFTYATHCPLGHTVSCCFALIYTVYWCFALFTGVSHCFLLFRTVSWCFKVWIFASWGSNTKESMYSFSGSSFLSSFYDDERRHKTYFLNLSLSLFLWLARQNRKSSRGPWVLMGFPGIFCLAWNQIL